MEDVQPEMWDRIIFLSVCNSWRMGRHFANTLINSNRVITIRPDNQGADPYKFWEPITYMMQKASKVALVSKQFLEVRLRLASRIRIFHRGLELSSVRAFCLALVRHKLWRYTLSYFYMSQMQIGDRKPAVDEKYCTCIFLHPYADPVESLPEKNMMAVKGINVVGDIACCSEATSHLMGLVVRV